MIVYWLACFAAVLIAYYGLQTDKGQRNKKIVICLAATPLFLIAALRYNVGSDYMSYWEYYENILHPFREDYWDIEIVFKLFNLILATLKFAPQWVFVFSSLVFIAAIFSQIFEDSPYPALSIFLLMGTGYYFGFFNVMRQVLGCAILMYSLRYIPKKRALPFFACVAIASGIHVSCAVFAVFYWIGRIRIRPVGALIMSLLVFGLQYVLGYFFENLVSYTRYFVYLDSIFANGGTAYVMLAINAILMVFASVFRSDDPKYRLYYNMQLFNLWVMILSGRVVLILRLMWIFGLSSIVLVPMALANIKDAKLRRICTIAIMVLYFIYASYTVGVMNSNHVLPYQTVFSR